MGLEFDVLCHWQYPPSWRLLWRRAIFSLPFCLEEYKTVDEQFEVARSLWCSLTITSTPVGPLQTSQRAWDAPMVVRDCQTLLNNATSDIDKARLLTVKADHGSE